MELSKNWQKIMDLVKEMSAVELNDLVKAFEEEFGVTAAATVVASWAPASDAAEWAWWNDSSNVELTEVWQQKINVIKVVKELMWLWLKEAKEMVEKAPVMLKENAKDDEIETFKTKLEEAGATVTVK